MQHSSNHDYSQCGFEGEIMEVMILSEKEFPALPVNQSESPAAKKAIRSVKMAAPQLNNDRSDNIEKCISGNTKRIEELKKKINIAFTNTKEMESKICKVEYCMIKLEKPCFREYLSNRRITTAL